MRRINVNAQAVGMQGYPLSVDAGDVSVLDLVQLVDDLSFDL